MPQRAAPVLCCARLEVRADGGCLNEYELLYIVSPRVPADDVVNAIERVSALITAQGGEVLSTDNWGRRRLAYPIRQYFEGTYVLATLRMPPAGALALEASLNITEEVIRHLLTLGIIPPRQPRARNFDDRDRGYDDRDRERAPEGGFAREGGFIPEFTSAPEAESHESESQPESAGEANEEAAAEPASATAD